MGTHYQHLGAEERATIMILLQQGCSARSIARTLQRSPSTITREIGRALDWPQRTVFVPAGSSNTYDARAAGARACAMRLKRRRSRKLAEDGVPFGVVHHFLLEGWSPSQIAGTLRRMWPDDVQRRVSHETIDNGIDAMPRVELRKELIACRSPTGSGIGPRAIHGFCPSIAGCQTMQEKLTRASSFLLSDSTVALGA